MWEREHALVSTPGQRRRSLTMPGWRIRHAYLKPQERDFKAAHSSSRHFLYGCVNSSFCGSAYTRETRKLDMTSTTSAHKNFALGVSPGRTKVTRAHAFALRSAPAKTHRAKRKHVNGNALAREQVPPRPTRGSSQVLEAADDGDERLGGVRRAETAGQQPGLLDVVSQHDLRPLQGIARQHL